MDLLCSIFIFSFLDSRAGLHDENTPHLSDICLKQGCLSPCQPKIQVKEEAIREPDPDWGNVENSSVLRQIKIWNFYSKTWTVHPLDWRGEGPSGFLISAQFKSLHLWWHRGCISRTGNLHIWKGTNNAERNGEILEYHILPSLQCLL